MLVDRLSSLSWGVGAGHVLGGPQHKRTTENAVRQNGGYCRSKCYIARMGSYSLFCSSDDGFNLDQIIFIYELDPCPLEMHQ